MKTAKLGTIWASSARIQYMQEKDGRMVWATIVSGIDTPNEIEQMIKQSKKNYPGVTLWVNSQTNGRYMV